MVRTPAPIAPEIIGRVRAERLPIHDIQALLGVGVVRATRIHDTAGQADFGDAGYTEVPVWDAPDAGEVVDIVPSDKEVAQRMFLADQEITGGAAVYLRSLSLAQPLWRSATYLGTDIERHVKVRPILGRAIIADGAYRPHFADKALNKAVKKTWKQWGDFIAQHWGGPADVVILGETLDDIDLPLGWDGGIPGVRHVFLDDLRDAQVFKGVESAKI